MKKGIVIKQGRMEGRKKKVEMKIREEEKKEKKNGVVVVVLKKKNRKEQKKVLRQNSVSSESFYVTVGQFTQEAVFTVFQTYWQLKDSERNDQLERVTVINAITAEKRRERIWWWEELGRAGVVEGRRESARSKLE